MEVRDTNSEDFHSHLVGTPLSRLDSLLMLVQNFYCNANGLNGVQYVARVFNLCI